MRWFRVLNYWMFSRPKRKLLSIPEVLSAVTFISLNEQWHGDKSRQINFEEELERAGLKRVGERRDQGGSGGRTYVSWLASLGLLFSHPRSGELKLTLAGEALMSGASPVEILKNQVLKFQFPSAYSVNININERFKIRPFRFILRLLMDERVAYLSQEEIAKIITTEAENESEECYEYIVRRLIDYRNFGNDVLPDNFIFLYPSRTGVQSLGQTFARLEDNANVLMNWIEYTQLAVRDENAVLRILPEMAFEVSQILSINPPFIGRWEDEEYFQRKYGVDPWHQKDTRNLNDTVTVTPRLYAQTRIRNQFFQIAAGRPIARIDASLIQEISDLTGIQHSLVEDVLANYPDGALGSFEAAYFDMAHMGQEQCRQFELATVELFKSGFGFQSFHVGKNPLNPDVLVISDMETFAGIIDNKAYSSYSISNDHKNRMKHNYIPKYKENYPLAFFMYIAGGFGNRFDAQVGDVSNSTNMLGCGINARNMIRLLREYSHNRWSHNDLLNLFQVNREIRLSDFVQ